MTRISLLALACMLSLLVGCENSTPQQDKGKASTPSSPSTQTDSPNQDIGLYSPINEAVKRIPPKPFSNHWGPVKPGPSKKVGLAAFFSRKARRVSLEKLKRSVPFLLGGVTWRHRNGQNMFDQLKLTLGGADYIALGKNNDDVTKLFLKLMDDMAMNVCKNAIAADYKKAANVRNFVRFESDVNANLRFIRLKFHAIYVPKTSTQGITKLRALYDKVLAKTKSQAKAWELICIATLTSPEFYAY